MRSSSSSPVGSRRTSASSRDTSTASYIYRTLTGILPTLETTRTALSALLPEERQITPSEVIRFVAHHYGIKVADLKGRDNRRSVAFPRQVAMYLIRELLNLSYPEIAKLFAKHHSTVMYSVETIANNAAPTRRWMRH